MSPHLYLASRSDELFAQLLPRLAAARTLTLRAAGLPRPIPVVLPSAQMADWLKVRLARELGLSMGFDFLQPSEYFKRHFNTDERDRAFAEAHAAWAPDQMRWRILPLVDDFAAHLGHDVKRPLLARDRFAYAQLLAQQFDRYMRHRPDWPNLWSKGEGLGEGATHGPGGVDEAWQRALWRTLSESPARPPHPARLLPSSEWTRADETATPHAPPVFVIGEDVLDPLLLRTLQCLARRGRPVSIHMLLPSLGYLGDQTRRARFQAALADSHPEDARELGGHPLLASLGQHAVGNFLLLEALSPDYEAWPEFSENDEIAPANASLLQRVQCDVRAQRLPAGAPLPSPDLGNTTAPAPDARPFILATDVSVQIHACHSPRRELEVLRDELFRAFTDLPGLRPEEVLVAVTDFEAYAALAPGILRRGAHPLPVRLTAIPASEANVVAVALLALLRLATGRHTASELMELLTLTAIQNHLEIAGEPETLRQLADTLRHSGLTHDIDAASRPYGDATGTWRAALDRALAGIWLGPIAHVRDAASEWVHPLAPELPQADAARLRFLNWLTRLADQQLIWQRDAPAEDWARRLETTVTTLLAATVHDEATAAVLRLISELKAVEAQPELDAGAVIDWLQPSLDRATSLRTSMGGEILLGRLDQLHGLPCRVFALLGLQDGQFPRSSRHPAWDLLGHKPERWDEDRRQQDRQWFLDALLAPTDRLILTAANRSLRTAHDGPLASCVEDLLRTAAATVRPAEGGTTLEKQLVRHHAIQPFAADYFIPGSPLPRSFDADAASIAAQITGSTQRLSAPFAPPRPLDQANSAPAGNVITIDQLIRFWKDPAAGWLRALDIETKDDDDDDQALDDPPLYLDGLQSYHVNAAALAAHAPGAQAAPAEIGARLIAERRLPPGALGRLVWDAHQHNLAPLIAALSPLLPQTKLEKITLDFPSMATLTGEVLLGYSPDPAPLPWVLIYRTGKYDKKSRYQLGAFIHALAATLQLNRPVTCQIASTDEEPQRMLAGCAPAEARAHLETLLAGYRAGQNSPLAFAPETSQALHTALQKADGTTALEVAEAAWQREPFEQSPAGEGLAPAAHLAWRDQDPFTGASAAAWLEWARLVAAPLEQWWLGKPITPLTPPAAVPAPAAAAATPAPAPPNPASARALL